MVNGKYPNLEDDITFLTVKELQEYLHISPNTAKSLINYGDFPVIRFGRRVLIPKEWLDLWLPRQTFKRIKL